MMFLKLDIQLYQINNSLVQTNTHKIFQVLLQASSLLGSYCQLQHYRYVHLLIYTEICQIKMQNNPAHCHQLSQGDFL